MKKKSITLGLAAAGVLFAGSALLRSPKQEVKKPTAQDRVVDTRSPDAAAPASSVSVSGPLLPSPSGVSAPAKNEIKARPVPAEIFSDLKMFSQLQLKPMPSDEEQRRRKELLHDRDFLTQLGPILLDPQMMMDPQFEVAENAALDLLIEALRAGDRETSLQVIRQVVEDKQVEDPSLPMSVRETLAGEKGELMYHAVAVAPAEFSNLSQSLPGPVSQKIWANVQEKHRQNLAESQLEVQAHEARWGKNQ